MKAKVLLRWIIFASINGDDLNIIDVPEEGEDEEEGVQNESWWILNFGACPPHPIAAGEYLYYQASKVGEFGLREKPDAEIEICNADNMRDYDYIYLYKLED